MSADHPKPAKRLIRNFFSLSLVQAANNFLPVLTVPVIARVIGPEKFGAINFAAAAIGYFTLLINYGFDLTATRMIAADPGNIAARNRIFSQVLFAKLLLLAVSLLIFVPALGYVPAIAAEKKLFIYTYIACFSLVITPNWLYQGMQDLHRMAVFNFISKFLFTLSVLLVVTKREDYVFQPLIISLSQIVTGACSFVWAIRKYQIRIAPVRFSAITALLWSEKTVFFSMVIVSAYTTTNTIILRLVQSNTDVAFYVAGWKLITVMQTFVSLPLRLSLFPFIGESFGKSQADGIARIRQLVPFISIFTATAGICIWLTAPWLIALFYGPGFEQGATVLRILCFVPLILSLGDLFGIQTMINLKMDKQFFNITTCGAVTGLLLTFSLSRQLGAAGTAWAWLITELLITSVMWVFLYSRRIRLIDFSYFRFKHLLHVIQTHGNFRRGSSNP